MVKLNINKNNRYKYYKKKEINVFNNAHEAINFTIEKGNNDELAFLQSFKLNKIKINF